MTPYHEKVLRLNEVISCYDLVRFDTPFSSAQAFAAAMLFPNRPLDALNQAGYQQLQQTVETHCRSLDYT